jgi:hypothetical protein
MSSLLGKLVHVSGQLRNQPSCSTKNLSSYPGCTASIDTTRTVEQERGMPSSPPHFRELKVPMGQNKKSSQRAYVLRSCSGRTLNKSSASPLYMKQAMSISTKASRMTLSLVTAALNYVCQSNKVAGHLVQQSRYVDAGLAYFLLPSSVTIFVIFS